MLPSTPWGGQLWNPAQPFCTHPLRIKERLSRLTTSPLPYISTHWTTKEATYYYKSLGVWDHLKAGPPPPFVIGLV